MDINPSSQKIPGFDLPPALNRLRGNWEKLQFLIISFIDKNSGSDGKLEELLKDQKHLEAQYMLHQIKGSGATLGAVAISSVADEIEQCLMQGDLTIPSELIVEFSGCISDLKNAKKILMPAEDSGSQSVENSREIKIFDKQQLDAILHTIQSNLTRDIALVVVCVHKLTELCESTKFEQLAVTIQTHLNDFELESISKDIGLYFQTTGSDGD